MCSVWSLGARERLRAQRGDSLIEVLIAAGLLVVIAGGIVTSLTVFGRESASQRQHSQADALAQQAEGSMRAMQLSSLAALVGTNGQTSYQTINGTKYTILNTASYVSAGTNGKQSCTGSGTAAADYIKTTTAVTWDPDPAHPDAHHKVVEEGIVTAASGGSLVVQVQDQNGDPDSGMTVTVVGTDPNTSSTNTVQSTDSNGCAVFYGLTAGTYNVSANGPNGAGWIDPTGNSKPTDPETLIAGSTTNVQFEMAVGGLLNVNFVAVAANGTQTPVSSYGGNGSTAWVLQNTSMTPSSLNETSMSVSPLFPFTSQYTVFAGSCQADNLAPSTVAVTSGLTPASTAPLLLPMFGIAVVTNGVTSSTSSTLTGVRFFDTGCPSTPAYPTQSLNVPNFGAGTNTTTQSQALPGGTYSACAQWAVASTATTSSRSTTSTRTTTSFLTTTGFFPRVTTTVTQTTSAPVTTSVTYTTTNTQTSNLTQTSVTNQTSATSTPTLSQSAATPGTC
jgi:Tfp pilus assembly protein PilV